MLSPSHTRPVYNLLVTAASISHFQPVASKPKKLVTRGQFNHAESATQKTM